jgi:hypothetical protein
MKDFSQEQHDPFQDIHSSQIPGNSLHFLSPSSTSKNDKGRTEMCSPGHCGNKAFWGWQKHYPSLRIAGVFLLIILVSLAGCGGQTNATVQPTPTVQLTPTSTPSPTSTPASGIFWNFDGSTQGWGTSEGNFKLAKVSVATSPVYAGSGSLEVTTTLIGAKSPAYKGDTVYTHTEATDYFNAQDFSKATASCFIYLPSGLAPNDTTPGYVQIFVKDVQYHNTFANSVPLGTSNTNSWFKLSLTISSGNPDSGFDPTKVSAIGVRVVLNDQSTLNYTGPFYLDSCSIGM